MDIHGLIQIIVAIIELGLGVYLFLTREKGHIIYAYSLFILGIVMWVGGNGLYRLVETNSAALFWTNMNHLSAGLIAVALVYFSIVYPYQKTILKVHHTLSFIVPLGILAYLLFATDTLIEKISGKLSNSIQVIGPTYTLFAVWFLIYMGWAFYNLIKKYHESTGMYRPLLRLLLIGLLISFIMGTLFDLFFPWFGGPQYFYIGTESSIVWLALTTYIIFRKA